MALIYKHLLDILKVESQLNGNDDWDQRGFGRLLPCCSAFLQSISDADTADSDRLAILPKALKCTSRLLNKLVSLVTNEVAHEKLALVVTNSLSTLLTFVSKGSEDVEVKAQLVLIEDDASVVMAFLQLLTILEGMVQQNVGDQPTNASNSDREPLTAAALHLYECLLTALFRPTPDGIVASETIAKLSGHKLNAAFDGALGSQLVLSLLTLCKHRAKYIASSAAGCLLLTMRCFAEHRSSWRACFPGTFSGLFVLSQSGFKRGSVLLSRVLQALLQLVLIVGQDALPENQQLLQYLSLDTDGTTNGNGKGTSSDTTSSAPTTAFAQLLHKLNKTSIGDVDTSVVVGQSGAGSAAGTVLSVGQDIGTVEQYVQWRVQVLQRIQAPLAVAYREVNKICSPLQRALHAQKLGATLAACVGFLGTQCVTEGTTALLSSTTDGTAVARDAAQTAWRSLQLALQQRTIAPHDAYLKIQDGLSRRYIDTVRAAGTAAAAGNEGKLKDHLHTLLGLGFGLQDHIAGLVRIADNSRVIVRLLRDLFSPDPSVCGMRLTASVLETRAYTYTVEGGEAEESASSSSHSSSSSSSLSKVEAGYHRVAWRSSQDPETKDLAARLALSLGRYGLMEDILDGSKRAVDHLQRHLHSRSGGTNITSSGGGEAQELAERVCRAVGALGACNIATLSLAALSCTPTPLTSAPIMISTVTEVVCARCGRASDASGMLRCSRCKGAHYCSKEHQQQHWSLHKVHCKPVEKATVSNKIEAAHRPIDNTERADLDSPTSLLTSSSIVAPLGQPRSAQHVLTLLPKAYSVLKLRYITRCVVQHYLRVIEHYLALRSATPAEVGLGSPTAPAQWGAYVLLAASAVEGLAHVAFSAGAGFEEHLRQVLYPLLELLVDTEPIVKQAARSSLDRIALYTLQAPLPALIRRNLDYIVDRICRELRSPSTSRFLHTTGQSSSSSSGFGGNTSTHLIVDTVFSTLTATVQASAIADTVADDLAPMCLLRDVICDTLENIDAFSVESRYGGAQLQALLRVLRVLACRAAPAPGHISLPDYSVKSIKSPSKKSAMSILPSFEGMAHKDHAAKAAACSLVEFAHNLILLKRFENPTSTAAEDEKNPFETADVEGKEENPAEEDGKNSDDSTSKPPAPGVQLLLDVLQRCCLFLTLRHTASQLTVVETMCAAFLRLSAPEHTAHLLPCIHTTWPVIMHRIVELRELLCQDRSDQSVMTMSTVSAAPSSSSSQVQASKVRLLPDQPATAPVLMTAVSTKRRTGAAPSVSTAAHPAAQRGGAGGDVSRALVLPALFELVGVMVLSSKSFMTLKLKEEFLPEVFKLLVHNLHEYVHHGGGGCSGVGSAVSSSTLTRANLLLTPVGEDATQPPEPTRTLSDRAGSKHALWSKVKVALLALLKQCCTVEEGVQRLLRAQATALCYVCLPLLSQRESEEVRGAAMALLGALIALDAAAVRALLRFVTLKTSDAATADQESTASRWLAMTQCPQINAIDQSDRAKHVRTSMHAEALLRLLQRDAGVQAGVTAVVTMQGSDIIGVHVDKAWTERLDRWAVV